MTYAIHEGNMDRLSRKMARIQNKCRQYGCDFKFEEVGEEYRELTGKDGAKYMARFVLVEAEGKAEINGWKFVASVEHTEKGNIINQACGIEVPERYYNCEPMCEHCGTKRMRRYLYIVMNEDSGEFKMVGRSCLKDFTGGMSAEAVAEYTAAFESIIEAEAPNGGSGEFKTYYDVREYLNTVAETISHFGYVKRSREEQDTMTRAENYYTIEHGGSYMYRELNETIKAEMAAVGFDSGSAEAARETEAALSWLEEQEETSNYMHNLKVACGLEYTDYRNLGILASLFPTFNRELEREAQIKEQAQAEAQSEWVGEIGQKVEIEIKSAVVVTGWETQWGYTRIWKITGMDGNVYTWKTGNNIREEAETIMGTVKAHNEYRGVKQTELTRCKVTGWRQEERKEYTGEAEEGLETFFEFFEGVGA